MFIRQTPPFSEAARENLQLSQSPNFFYVGSSCVGHFKFSSAPYIKRNKDTKIFLARPVPCA